MAMQARKFAEELEPAGVAPSARRWAAGGAPAGASIVGDMQAELEQRLNETPGKWSKRRTLVFVLSTCGAFWGLVLFALLS